MLILAVIVKHGIVLCKHRGLGHDLGCQEMRQNRINGDDDRGKCRFEVSICSVVLLAEKSVIDNTLDSLHRDAYFTGGS